MTHAILIWLLQSCSLMAPFAGCSDDDDAADVHCEGDEAADCNEERDNDADGQLNCSNEWCECISSCQVTGSGGDGDTDADTDVNLNTGSTVDYP
ncbi:MAG: hypothetical protein JXX14_06915 [Deltaproteobacteria bacterium]|nr:hypothetical protein [Deltaproteobacteria bacterium]